jgi:hypothetical protein
MFKLLLQYHLVIVKHSSMHLNVSRTVAFDVQSVAPKTTTRVTGYVAVSSSLRTQNSFSITPALVTKQVKGKRALGLSTSMAF